MRLKSVLVALVLGVHCGEYLALAASQASSPEIVQARTNADFQARRELYYTADSFVSEADLSKAVSSAKVAGRLGELSTLLTNNGLNSIDRGKLGRVVAFIKLTKSKIADKLKEEVSVYVHPSKTGIFCPVQFYRNGHVYIHLKKNDPIWKEGGFKNFSRTIDYRKQRMFANLVMTVGHKHDLQGFFSELDKMYTLRNEPLLIHFRDISSYVGYSEKVLRQKVNFQSELFAGDLGHMFNDIASGDPLVKAALDATQALLDLHRNKYYHRDIKPGNFFVRRQGNQTTLVLADFGLSQHPDDANFCRGLGGTRGYIAPELCRSNSETGHPCSSWAEVVAADTFSLGMTFYNSLVGRDSTLKQEITLLNELVMPRKNTAPLSLSLETQLEKIDEVYEHLVAQDPRQMVGEDRKRQQVYRLFLAALHPQAAKRISLQNLKSSLIALLPAK